MAPEGPQGWLRPLSPPRPCTHSAHSHVRAFGLAAASTGSIPVPPGWLLLTPYGPAGTSPSQKALPLPPCCDPLFLLSARSLHRNGCILELFPVSLSFGCLFSPKRTPRQGRKHIRLIPWCLVSAALCPDDGDLIRTVQVAAGRRLNPRRSSASLRPKGLK